jgi:hypothetical protein
MAAGLAIGCSHASKLGVTGTRRRLRVFESLPHMDKSAGKVYVAPIERLDFSDTQTGKKRDRMKSDQLVVLRFGK